MTRPDPADPRPPNAWFTPEHDFEDIPPAEPDIAETIPLDPTDPENLHRLLHSLRKL